MPLAALVVGLKEYESPALTLVAGVPEMVRAATTLIVNAGKELV